MVQRSENGVVRDLAVTTAPNAVATSATPTAPLSLFVLSCSNWVDELQNNEKRKVTLIKLKRPGKALPPLFLTGKGAIMTLRNISDLGMVGSSLEGDWVNFFEAAKLLRELLNGGAHMVFCLSFVRT